MAKFQISTHIKKVSKACSMNCVEMMDIRKHSLHSFTKWKNSFSTIRHESLKSVYCKHRKFKMLSITNHFKHTSPPTPISTSVSCQPSLTECTDRVYNLYKNTVSKSKNIWNYQAHQKMPLHSSRIPYQEDAEATKNGSWHIIHLVLQRLPSNFFLLSHLSPILQMNIHLL